MKKSLSDSLALSNAITSIECPGKRDLSLISIKKLLNFLFLTVFQKKKHP